MTVGSLCNLNFQQFTSAAFRGTVVRERERERDVMGAALRIA